MRNIVTAVFLILLPLLTIRQKSGGNKFDYLDVFNLEYVSGPEISPDGSRIV